MWLTRLLKTQTAATQCSSQKLTAASQLKPATPTRNHKALIVLLPVQSRLRNTRNHKALIVLLPVQSRLRKFRKPGSALQMLAAAATKTKKPPKAQLNPHRTRSRDTGNKIQAHSETRSKLLVAAAGTLADAAASARKIIGTQQPLAKLTQEFIQSLLVLLPVQIKVECSGI
jgi:hypothetical protein